MSRNGVLASVSVGLVVLGIGVALSGLAAPAATLTSRLPAVTQAFPADATFVGGFDVKRLAASAFYQKQVAARNLARPDAFRHLEEETGLNPERDVDRVFVAGLRGGTSVAVVLGAFDVYKLRAAAALKAGAKAEKVGDLDFYSFAGKNAAQPQGIAFVDQGTLLTGDAAGVRAMLEAHGQHKATLRTNVLLGGLLDRARTDATFWLVGDGTLLSNLPTGGSSGGLGSNFSMPNLKSLSVSGDLEPLVTISATGDAADAAGAKNLADTARGLTSLLALQAGAKPELKELATAFTITQKASQVVIDFRVSPETLAALAPKPAVPTATPRAQ